jgi:glycosyltransferase involved in cell wall biosynthesis
MVVLRKTRNGCRGRGTLLLVRNGVSHDARVLRAARVARQTLGGETLVVGVATASAPAGEAQVEGVRVWRTSPAAMRLPAVRRKSSSPPANLRQPHSGLPPDTFSPLLHPDTASPPLSADASSPLLPPDTASPPLSADAPPRLSLSARVKRTLAGALFTWQALRLARRVHPRLVHANDWNTMWCGMAIKLTCGTRLVYDSHELWADRNGRWEQRWWLLASEALFVRVADEVLTASPGYADALAKRYRIARPTVIRNIPDLAISENSSDIGPDPPHLPDLKATRNLPTPRTSHPPTPALAVYVGGLMPGRGLEQTIDALALAPTIRLQAIGPGAPAYRKSLTARALARGVADRVELTPPVSPALIPEVLAQATAGLCLIQPVCRSYELTLPNKLFEYAAAGVPVLASDLPVIAAAVRAGGLGEVVPCADSQAIAAALERLAAHDRWSEASGCAQAFARANSWSAESRTLARLYVRAAGEPI